jgi:hypothetical protein
MEQNKMKKLAPIIIAIIAAGGISFYGGMRYEQSKNQSKISGQGNFQSLSTEERQQMMQQGGSGMNGMRGTRTGADASTSRNGAAGGLNFASGEIISKDDKSVTVKLRDGGSRIVFYSENTEIGKFASGTSGDLVSGESVSVNGTANQDGSITAQSIQLMPETRNRQP